MRAKKTKWIKTPPKTDCWIWIKYKDKYNRYSICPAMAVYVGDVLLVHSARNTSWTKWPNSPGMMYIGKHDKTLSFGPKIRIPKL